MHPTVLRWEIRESDFMDDLEVWEGDRQIACHLNREDAEVIIAAQATLDALFEIRDDCADLHEGDDLQRLAYRVAATANGAINRVLAACAKRPSCRWPGCALPARWDVGEAPSIRYCDHHTMLVRDQTDDSPPCLPRRWRRE